MGGCPTELPKNLPNAPQDSELPAAQDPEAMQAKTGQHQGRRCLSLFYLFHLSLLSALGNLETQSEGEEQA